jgi:broad specificity phosphatase PhoE
VRIVLIRHGETAHNAEQLILGQADVPLNERGLLQAQALAKTVAAGGPIAAVTAVYSSPLQRAVATAMPLAETLDLPVQDEAGLIEMDVGEMDGQTFPDLQRRYPDFLRRWLSAELADVRMPGGETLREVQDRAWAAVESIRDRHPEETVAVVTHNFVVLTTLCRVLELPLAQFRHLRHDLAAVSLVELTPQRQVVLSLNDRCHLRAEGLDRRTS